MAPISENLYAKLGCDIDAANLPVRAEQLRTRLRDFPLMIISQIGMGVLLLGLMWDRMPHDVLLGWLAVQCAAHAFEIYHWWRHREETRDIAECKRWRSRFIVFVTMVGAVWGSAGVLMFVPGDLAYQAMLICVMLGLAAGAVTINPVFPPALYIYVSFLILPVLVASLRVGDVQHLVLGAMLAVYWIFVLNAGRGLAQTFELSLRRSFENAHLVMQLTEEKRRAEAAQQQAEQANQMKSRFLAAASHDLRQPMHALTLFVAALKGQVQGGTAAQLAGQIERSVEVLGSMFDALLDISRLDAGVVQPHCETYAIQPLLDRMYAEFSWLAQDKQLRLDVASCDAWIYTDAMLLERILRNLIANAIRYTERGAVSLSCKKTAEGIVLAVRDSGVGIAEEHLPHIFEEYYQVGNVQRDRNKGLGLGLAIVKRLTELLGCRIRVTSVLGEGSCFMLTIPARGPDVMIDPVETA
ncbi:MAG TPA: HAMP domain-containing sensor histidine kinase [Gallionella sp.]|nr:HAMP domain-containing sensor histidine kinase [Gallionella sp.]